MLNRREMVSVLSRLLTWGGAVLGMVFPLVPSVLAEIRKRVLPKNADPKKLRNANPRYLDTRNLQVMPLDSLESVGDSEALIDIADWRLDITGAVAHPMTMTYDDIQSMPAVEKKALLICPGIFAFHGQWKGIPLTQIIDSAMPRQAAKAFIVYGYSRSGTRKERFKLDIPKQKNFLLAYAVNGQRLEMAHGYPLRVVAPGHWGEQWVKYVTRIEFV